MNKKIIARLILAAIAPMAVSASAYATDLTPGSGTGVAGSCYLIPMPNDMVSPTQLDSVQNDILNTLSQGTQSLHAAQTMQAQAEVNDWNQFVQGLTDFLRRESASKIADKYAQNASSVNQPTTICEQATQASAANTGSVVAATTAAQIMKNLKTNDQGTASAATYQGQMANLTPAETSAGSLFTPNPNSAITPSDMNTYIGALTTPTVPITLKGSEASTPADAQWELDHRAFVNYVTLAQSGLKNIGADNLPSTDGAPFLAEWQSSGQPGNPPGYNAATGKISVNGALAADVASRYANQNWYASLSSEGSSGVLREQTLMMAVALRQNQQRLEMTEQLVSNMAAKFAIDTHNKSDSSLAAETTVSADQSARGMKQ